MRAFIPNPGFLKELQYEAPDKAARVEAATAATREANKIRHHIMPQKKDPAVEVQTNGNRVFMVNTDYGSHLDEWGSVKNPAYAPLRNGVRNAGLNLEET